MAQRPKSEVNTYEGVCAWFDPKENQGILKEPFQGVGEVSKPSFELVFVKDPKEVIKKGDFVQFQAVEDEEVEGRINAKDVKNVSKEKEKEKKEKEKEKEAARRRNMRYDDENDYFSDNDWCDDHGYPDEDVFRGVDGEYHTYDEYGDVNDLW